jgi:hypothetical protein
MPDNTTLNTGAGGDVIATDEISDAGVADGAKVQRVKVGFGADNNYADVEAGTALPVDVESSVLPTGAATAANQTSVIGTDGAAGPASVLSVGGTEAGGNIQELRVDGDGHPQVDVLSSALPTGAATEATLASVVGTDGAAGPASAVSIAGTEAGGNLQEVLVDAAGHLQVDVLTGGGGGTQYTEDDIAAGNPVGTQPVMVADSTPGLEVPDADVVAQRATRYGAAYVQVVNSTGTFVDTFGGSGGTAQADESAFVEGTTNMTPVGGVFNETHTAVTEDQTAALRMTANRALHSNLRADDGTSCMDTTAAAAKVLPVSDDGTSVGDDANSAIRVNIVAGSAGATEYTEDVPAVADPIGGQMMARRRDSPAAETTTDGDVTALNCTTEGSLHVELRNGIAQTGLATNPIVVRQTNGSSVYDLPPASTDGAAHGASQLGVRVMGTDGTNDQQVLVDATGNVQTAAASVVPATATGTITVGGGAGDNVSLDVGGYGSAGIQITGTWTGTIDFQATVDGTNWVSIRVLNPNADLRPVNTTTNGMWQVACGGYDQIRCVSVAGISVGPAQIDMQAQLGAARPEGFVTVSQAATVTTQGTKTPDDAPSTNSMGTLPVVSTAAAPTYTEGRQNPLSTDLSGGLRVDGSAVTQPVSGTVTVTHPQVGGGTEAGAQRVTIANDSTGTLTVDGTVSVTHPALGGGVEAGAQRVTLANDSTGTLTVDAPAATPVAMRPSDGAAFYDLPPEATDGAAHGASQLGVRIMGSDATNDQQLTCSASGELNIRNNGAAANLPVEATGTAAADAPISGNPVRIGAEVVEMGADPPTMSADADTTNVVATPQGVLWTLGGNPNIITREYRATGVQTNDDMLGAVAAGSHVVVTMIDVTVDNATTVNPQVRIGFGTTSVPAEPADGAGVNGMVVAASGLAPGSGIVKGNGSGAIAIGASDEELRITCDAPTTGEIKVIITYYVATL